MTVPVLNPASVAYFARLIFDESEFTDLPASEQSLVTTVCLATQAYVCDYCGLPLQSDEPDDTDRNDTLLYAMNCICAEMIDNRNISWEYNNTNPLVRSVLGLYTTNSLPEEDE